LPQPDFQAHDHAIGEACPTAVMAISVQHDSDAAVFSNELDLPIDVTPRGARRYVPQKNLKKMLAPSCADRH
jgi:hypothetical protein